MQPILTVDLTTGDIGTILIPEDWERDYLGGSSLAARLLFEELMPDLDPLSPRAPLLFMNGPLTGTAGPAVGRFVICARSPATGIWGESNCGGFWGPELRMAGYDGLLVSGMADRPVYILIQDGKAEIRSAEAVWGLDTYETQEALKSQLGIPGLRIASIGPAGESQIHFALVLCDHGRVAGRTGMGAVMGSKKLKAVAVKGSNKIPLVDWQAYSQLRAQANRDLRSDSISQVLRDLGSASAADYFDYLGFQPKRYYQLSKLREESQITGAVISERLLDGVSACHACVIACGRVVRLEDGIRRKGPEYETLVGFGPNLELNDPVVATRLGEWCDRYGMDSISLSNTIGFAIKLFEEGKIKLQDTGELELMWGDSVLVEKLIHLTARREGFGEYLAEGAKALGARFNAEDEAVQVNGLEVPYQDPRGSSGMALVYATSPTGANHNQSDYFLADIGQIETILGMNYFDPRSGVEKAANVARHQDWRTVSHSLVVCIFANIPPEIVLNLVNAACGFEWTLDDLMLAGERGWNIKRLINFRLGLTRADDRLPKPLLTPFPDDPEGFIPDFQAMLEAYYQARGWDITSGFPSHDKLLQLGLDWATQTNR